MREAGSRTAPPPPRLGATAHPDPATTEDLVWACQEMLGSDREPRGLPRLVLPSLSCRGDLPPLLRDAAALYAAGRLQLQQLDRSSVERDRSLARGEETVLELRRVAPQQRQKIADRAPAIHWTHGVAELVAVESLETAARGELGEAESWAALAVHLARQLLHCEAAHRLMIQRLAREIVGGMEEAEQPPVETPLDPKLIKAILTHELAARAGRP